MSLRSARRHLATVGEHTLLGGIAPITVVPNKVDGVGLGSVGTHCVKIECIGLHLLAAFIGKSGGKLLVVKQVATRLLVGVDQCVYATLGGFAHIPEAVTVAYPRRGDIGVVDMLGIEFFAQRIGPVVVVESSLRHCGHGSDKQHGRNSDNSVYFHVIIIFGVAN